MPIPSPTGTAAPATGTDVRALIDRHSARLEAARAAITNRGYHSAFPESPSPRTYGEEAGPAGEQAFTQTRGTTFPGLNTAGAAGTVATERSPYGFDLDVSYPYATEAGLDGLLAAAARDLPRWRTTDADVRVGVALEILDRLHARVFELAHAVQHTSGQPFVMAFQAGGTHALDRALEAVAYASFEMDRVPRSVLWEKPVRGGAQRLEKTFTPVGRGVAVVIGCRTFPTWNSYPGLFASLATGNSVIVKPHPGSVLPLAITVAVCREVLVEYGCDPDLVQLAAEKSADGVAKALCTRPEVRLIDYTGGPGFGDWLETHCPRAQVFTEKAGVNVVVLDSCEDAEAVFADLAFTLVLYSGQMCTTTQNLYVPRAGLRTSSGTLSPAEVAEGLAAAVRTLTQNPKTAGSLLGAIVDEVVTERQHDAVDAAGSDRVVLAPEEVTYADFPDARIRTPALLTADLGGDDGWAYESECFGPVSFVLTAPDTDAALEHVQRSVHRHGAMTAGIYSTDDDVLARMREVCLLEGVALSENLPSGVYVNQSAAFSDFHGTGANPAANATYTDGAFVAGRFRIVQSRRPA